MPRASSRRNSVRTKASKLSILFVDDQASELARTLKLGFGRGCAVEVLDPEQLKKSAVMNADVILVDFDLAHWHRAVREDESGEPIARRAPPDGLALIGQLRSIGEMASIPRPTAYAIHTGQKIRLPGGSSWDGPEHLLARALNIEWVFEKNVTDASNQILDLARAARRLPRRWPTSGPANTARAIQRLLGLTRAEAWVSRALEQIATCEPPLQDTAVATRGLCVLRWLLHGILPYPTFLIDERALAVRIGVTVSSLRTSLNNEPALRRLLAPAAYDGVLAEFLGRRWWRAGVDSIFWSRAKGATDPSVLTTVFTARFVDLVPLAIVYPVALLGSDLRSSDEVADASSALEIRPDGWPTYAERAWIALRDAIDDPQLRALVVEADLGRIPVT